jgi:hypothetical protein
MKNANLSVLNEAAVVNLLLNIVSPPGSDQPSVVSWVKKLDVEPGPVVEALAAVPGIRGDGGRIWRLGEPSDRWTLTIVVIGSTLVAMAPRGWAGGQHPGESQFLFDEWMEAYVAKLTFPSTP